MDTGKLTLHFLSVGDGHSTYIEFPNGQNALVDINIGNDSPAFLFKKIKINTLNYLIITHPHRGHITGLKGLLKNIKIEKFIYSPVNFKPRPTHDDWKAYERLKKINPEARTRRVFTHIVGGVFLSGSRFGGVNITYLAPAKAVHKRQKINVNNESLIMKLSYGQNKIIICGDTEEDVWEEVSDAQVKGTTLLLASHHGNKIGYCRSKISVMAPKYVVISGDCKTEFDAEGRYRYHTDKWNRVIKTLGGDPPKRVYATRESAVKAVFNLQSLENIANV